MVELTHLVGKLNHQSTCLAELCKPPHFTVQASYREAGVKSSALPTRVGVVAGGLPKKNGLIIALSSSALYRFGYLTGSTEALVFNFTPS